MPEPKWEARILLGLDEYAAFLAWYRGIFGAEAPAPPNEEGILDNPAYTRFKEEKRPGFTSLEKLPPEEQKLKAIQWSPPAEEEVTDLSIGEVVVPGKLVRMPDGTYQDYASGLPVAFDVATRILSEYQPEEGVTDWQQAQLDIEREKFEWQMSEAALEKAGAAREQELTNRLRLEQELSGLGGPADWIKRWQMIHGVIPRAEAQAISSQAWSLLTEAQGLTGAERLTKEMQATQLEETANKLVSQTQGLPEAPGFYFTPMREWTPPELEQAQRYEASLTDVNFTKPSPTTPEWLPQFAPSQVAGEPITKEKVTTPTPEQWAKTPWSVREGLRGYTEYAGFRPYTEILEDIATTQGREEAQKVSALPRTPYVSGRWSPARQR